MQRTPHNAFSTVTGCQQKHESSVNAQDVVPSDGVLDNAFSMMAVLQNCEEIMNQFTMYDEKIVRGFVVQIFYWVLSLHSVRQQDEELKELAAEYGGKPTSEQGWNQGRRDIDFEFGTVEDAQRFANRISTQTIRFYVHDQMNSLGQLVPKPSLTDLEHRKSELKRINCTERIHQLCGCR